MYKLDTSSLSFWSEQFHFPRWSWRDILWCVQMEIHWGGRKYQGLAKGSVYWNGEGDLFTRGIQKMKLAGDETKGTWGMQKRNWARIWNVKSSCTCCCCRALNSKLEQEVRKCTLGLEVLKTQSNREASRMQDAPLEVKGEIRVGMKISTWCLAIWVVDTRICYPCRPEVRGLSCVGVLAAKTLVASLQLWTESSKDKA